MRGLLRFPNYACSCEPFTLLKYMRLCQLVLHYYMWRVFVIDAIISHASEGNILEAINLAVNGQSN